VDQGISPRSGETVYPPFADGHVASDAYSLVHPTTYKI